jgi:hypothetical protein
VSISIAARASDGAAICSGLVIGFAVVVVGAVVVGSGAAGVLRDDDAARSPPPLEHAAAPISKLPTTSVRTAFMD